MKKFILIDQSIIDSGGHHLEYALRVLRAAKIQGYYTILAVNTKCKDFNHENIDKIEKAFSNTFWENFECKKIRKKPQALSLVQRLKDIKDNWQYSIIFSNYGMAYHITKYGNSFTSLLRRYRIVGKDINITTFEFLSVFFINKIQKIFISKNKYFSFLVKIFKWLLFFILIPLKVLVGLFILPILFNQWRLKLKSFDHFTQIFAKECKQLLSRINVNDGDLIFVPTLGGVELSGIGQIGKSSKYRGLDWHLLFRRNIFNGREPGYLKQIPEIQEEVLYFSEFKQNFLHGKVSLYTDTVPLTEQYNTIGVYRFKTLPIPIGQNLAKQHLSFECLTVAYLGDARGEKGFPLIPGLIKDVRAAGYGSDRVRFLIQSNFNIPLGEPNCRIAKSELVSLQDDGVELIEGPFDSNEYENLINQADILLVPYDENNYYARSSGIFAEGIFAGIPILYPTKTWMGRELLEENKKHVYLLEQSIPGENWNETQFNNISSLEISINSSDSPCLIFFKTEMNTPYPGVYLKINLNKSIRAEKKIKAKKFIKSVLLDLRETSGMIFMDLEANGNYIIDFEVDYDSMEDTNSVTNKIYFNQILYRCVYPAHPIPIQKISRGYISKEDISSAFLEMLQNYNHYSTTCHDFSHTWREYHNADRLVKELSGN